MSKINVIHPSCLPSKFPLTTFGLLTMYLDQYHTLPGWAWGVYGTLVALLLAGFALMALDETKRHLPGFGDRPGQGVPTQPPPRNP